MRLAVIRELKQVRRFLDAMESTVKNRNPLAIQKAYIFLQHIIIEMDKGVLCPTSIDLDLSLAHALIPDEEDEK